MATTYKYQQPATDQWTYGAELEWVDWPRLEKLPKGIAVDDGNYTSVNSNGVAVDGKGKSYPLGGEILTAPSESVSGPSDQMNQLMNRWPRMTFNYRTGLNTHVRIPGLAEDVKKLKKIQKFVHRVMPDLLGIIDPIPTPGRDVSALEKRCCRIRYKDHHTLLPDWRLELQLKADTPRKFFEAEVVHLKTGKLHWAIVPRTCVNLRQIMQTETVEFRHFFMPATEEELLNTMEWSKLFLETALEDDGKITAKQLLEEFDFDNREWPKPLPYDSWLDEGFFFTSPHHNDRSIVAERIKEWLARPSTVERLEKEGLQWLK